MQQLVCVRLRDSDQRIYRTSCDAFSPFPEDLIMSDRPRPIDQSVLDTSLLFAMIVYGVVALFFKAAIDWLTTRIGQRRQRLEQQACTDPDGPPGGVSERPEVGCDRDARRAGACGAGHSTRRSA
jgi:hypothetical protein